MNKAPQAEKHIQAIINTCAGQAGCGVCRLHLAGDCLFFDRLFQVSDQALASGKPPEKQVLYALLDLCILCGLCPCPDIRTLILSAKADRADERGIGLPGRLLSDPGLFGQLGRVPARLFSLLVSLAPAHPIMKHALGIHPDVRLPRPPAENFFSWARRTGIDRPDPDGSVGNFRPKVAYFAGCSAGYLFPEVAKATVKTLACCGVDIYIPPQVCCGMPLIMEGDQKKALNRIRFNMTHLIFALQHGYDIVCSCPTCGYFFQSVLLETAYYSDAYQKQSNTQNNDMRVPLGSGSNRFTTVPGAIYRTILKDDGYFSSLPPLDRIRLSQAVTDLGQYLKQIHPAWRNGMPDKSFPARFIYFAPCHQREQDIGQPYHDLIKSMPGMDISCVDGAMQCCGMGGHLGMKAGFYPLARQLGRPLFERLSSETKRVILTDCLSCRMQFEQVLCRPVFHPVEVLSDCIENPVPENHRYKHLYRQT